MSAKILISETGKILYSEGDIDAVCGIASLSKIWATVLLYETFKSIIKRRNMTVDQILEEKIVVDVDYEAIIYNRIDPRPDLLPPDDPLTYQPFRKEKACFRLPIKQGKTYIARELFEAALFQSKNDAIQALTDHFFANNNNLSFIAGSALLAQKLGLQKTKIGDPHGLCDGDNISTARELGIICTYVIQENVLDFFQKFNPKGREHTANKLLKDERLANNKIRILMAKTATGNNRQGDDMAESLMVIAQVHSQVRSAITLSDRDKFNSVIELLVRK